MLDAESLRRQVEVLLASDRVTEPTRKALTARLAYLAGPPRLLSAEQMRTVRAVAARLIPLPELETALDLAGRYDVELATGAGDGWRYAELPRDAVAVVRGLDALDAGARGRHGCAFADLAGEQQDALLAEAQLGEPQGAAWPLSSRLWFEEVLAALSRLAYAHPMLQTAIGYEGFADAHGMASRA